MSGRADEERRIARRPGDTPLHAVATLASLLIVGFALWMVLRDDNPVAILIWLGAAAVVHDLVAFPLYSLFGLLAFGRATPGADRLPADPQAVNYVRVPLFVSGVLLLVWAPSILGWSSGDLAFTTGNDPDFLGRWLLLSAGLFTLSGVACAFHIRGLRRKRTI